MLPIRTELQHSITILDSIKQEIKEGSISYYQVLQYFILGSKYDFNVFSKLSVGYKQPFFLKFSEKIIPALKKIFSKCKESLKPDSKDYNATKSYVLDLIATIKDDLSHYHNYCSFVNYLNSASLYGNEIFKYFLDLDTFDEYIPKYFSLITWFCENLFRIEDYESYCWIN